MAAATIAATIGFLLVVAAARAGAGELLRQCASKSASSLGSTLMLPMMSQTQDVREGMRAFAEKRSPKFTGK